MCDEDLSMHGILKTTLGVFLLLALASCKIATLPCGDCTPNLKAGTTPRSSAVFCDIETEAARHCATETEKATGIRLASAAVALVTGKTAAFALDDSPAALARCSGEPEVVTFRGSFPEGLPVCVNCGEALTPNVYADVNAICAAQCEDFFGITYVDGDFSPNNPPHAADVTFCQAHAHASTNFPQHDCFAGACTTAGTLRTDFVDPRRTPEPVAWQNLIGVGATGGSLVRTAASTGNWDAGAASTQVITSGDGYVEFTATETDRARVAGLSSGAPPDQDPNYAGIGFGIDLFSTGQISIFENGTSVQNFGAYVSGEKFRVKVSDNFDGTAKISYTRITGPCVDGSPCNETVFYTSLSAGTYPFRVDSSLFSQGATLTDVRLVRIR
jgi:hypothetical protein